MAEKMKGRPLIVRRVLHISLALIIVFYLFPNTLFGIPTIWYLVVMFVAIPFVIEFVRLTKKIKVYGLREHEQHHIASYVWFTTGAVLLIALLPQQIAAPCIVGAAVGDPVLGMTRDERRRYTLSTTYLVLLLIFIIFQYHIAIALIAAGIMLISESVEFRVKWQLRPYLFYSRSKKKISPYQKFFEIFVKTDDDFMMQVIPALTLTIIFVLIGWQYLPPELISVDPALAKFA